MASGTSKAYCVKCRKERATLKCAGCSQDFCFDHLTDHRQDLGSQLDDIEMNRDLFRQTLNEHMNDPKKHLLIKQIDQWEEDSIYKIRQTAEHCRQLVLQHTNEHLNEIEINLNKLTNQLRETRKENDFNEIELNQFKQKLEELAQELNKPRNISIQHDCSLFINQISVVMPSRKKWRQTGITVAGGYGQGNELNQFDSPRGIYIDDDRQCIYIADTNNHRIIEWKFGGKNGKIVAGGNGKGSRNDQLNNPVNIIIDKKKDSLIICDQGNRRIVQWPCQNGKKGNIIMANIDCWDLAIDNDGNLYASAFAVNEVIRWKNADENVTIVAGGTARGDLLNQLNYPTYIFVDQNHSVYVSDQNNNRVMKWMEGAQEGIFVVGEQGKRNSLTQLNCPTGVIVDHLNNVYVADSCNHRIIRRFEGSTEGSIIIGGERSGRESNELSYPRGISFDQQGNLYVVDGGNHRIQKFDIDST